MDVDVSKRISKVNINDRGRKRKSKSIKNGIFEKENNRKAVPYRSLFVPFFSRNTTIEAAHENAQRHRQLSCHV
jgi:hypothetical protein